MMFIRLAWRNIWRNRRRTLITAASVFFAMLLAVMMRSLQHGVYNSMIRNAAGMYLGYVQVHDRGYWRDKSLDNTFVPDSTLYRDIRRDKRISVAVPRLESFALASSGNQTRVAVVIGTDPGKEALFTGLNRRITRGGYFSGNGGGALLAEELAAQLHLKVNDTLVLLGQGFEGSTAAGKFRVEGLFHIGSPDLDRTVIYLPLSAAQQLYGTGNRLTSLSLNLTRPGDAAAVAADLGKRLDSSKWEVMDWKQMIPQLEQFIRADSAGGIIIIWILYLIIAFGIFGTILMMLAERRHELGILTAIGMRGGRMGWMVFMELLFIILVGVTAGLALAIPVVAWLHLHPVRITGQAAEAYRHFGLEPVIPFSNDPGIFISQIIAVLAICSLLSLYAWYKVLRVNPAENLSS